MTTAIKIKTNRHQIPVLYFHDLSPEELGEFDLLDDAELDEAQFARYKGQVYYLNDFISTVPGPFNHGLPELFEDWDGYQNDSFFSGVLVKYCDDYDHVIMGTYYS